jgi:CubicO group peptidase (beta-lactamase class C family)
MHDSTTKTLCDHEKKDQLTLIQQDNLTFTDITKTQDLLIAYLDAQANYKNFHGVVLVTQNDKIIFNRAYGMADYQNNIPNTPETKFALGSVSKQCTAVAIMQLYEQGLLDINDNLSKYIPDFIHGNEITIHQLLTHTSGLLNDYNLFEDSIIYKNFSEALEHIKNRPLLFTPGQQFSYSNTGYMVLGHIIEKVSRQKYEEYLKQNIFEPLSMHNTGICFKKDSRGCDSLGYVGFLDLLPINTAGEKMYMNYLSACNIYSTVEDLYIWEKALRTEQLIKKETEDKIFTPYCPVSDKHGSYGYAWFLKDTPYGTEHSHNGNTTGFSSIISHYDNKNVTIIMLSNHGFLAETRLKNNLASIIFDKKYNPPTELKEISVNPDIYDQYTGSYEFFPGFNIEIIKKDNHLCAQLAGTIYQMFAQTEQQYFFRLLDGKIIFNQNGQELVLTQDDQPDLVAKKIIVTHPNVGD